MRYIIFFTIVFIFFAEAKEMNSLFGIKIGQSISELKIIECRKYQNIKSCRIIPKFNMYNLEYFYIVPEKKRVVSVFGQKDFLYPQYCLANLEAIKEGITNDYNVLFSDFPDKDKVGYIGKSGRNTVIIYCTVIKVLDIKTYNLTVMLIGSNNL
ncbi:hypothetical protein [Persephonella sp.]|uniref:hypothetical protein n=1 Tax=Persephonella sp. TaxID=2060922 RepID=UPI0025DD233A|nr:hypothetical protein [Persephonella sp.]